jgi:hypothetical protein
MGVSGVGGALMELVGLWKFIRRGCEEFSSFTLT